MDLFDVVLQGHDLVRPLALALGTRLGECGATSVVCAVCRVEGPGGRRGHGRRAGGGGCRGAGGAARGAESAGGCRDCGACAECAGGAGGACEVGVGGGRGVLPLRLRQLVLGDGDGLRLAPGGGGALELRLDRVDLHRALRIRRVEVTHGVLGRLLGRNLLVVPQALLLLLDARAVGEAQVLAQELLAA